MIEDEYDISSVRGNVATIYATEQELNQLKKDGYELQLISTQQPAGQAIPLNLGTRHNYASLTSELHSYAAAYPDICRLSSLGQSVQGREIWAILITDNPDTEEDEPEFKYVSSMHGNEWVGLEMCLYFIDILLTDYGSVSRISNLLDRTVIWIVPCMNPDGLEAATRYNANGYDLNRAFPDFPDELNDTIFDGAPLNDQGRQPEVAAIMHWSVNNSFTLAANFHTGALLVNYPYDDDNLGSVYSPSPDNDLYIDISKRYSIHNTPMWNNPAFPPYGIVNGADWYTCNGVMQDWNYRYLACNATTIELSNSHTPPESSIPNFWADNQESMLAYAEAVHIGVRGIITDRATGLPLWAEVRIEGNTQPVFTDPDVGDYHRMLLPGIYDLSFDAPGYAPVTFQNVTVTDGPATRLDVELLDPDLTNNGYIDLADFAVFAMHWPDPNCLDEPNCEGADITGDGRVWFDDLQALSDYWMTNIGMCFTVFPLDVYYASGPEGGPFLSAGRNYILRNHTGSTINWSTSQTQNLFDVIPAAGTLSPQGELTMQVCISAQAETLEPGTYTNTITFSDTTHNIVTTRTIILEITPRTMLAYWKLNESSGSTAADVTGNGHDGTLVNMNDSDWVLGKYANALDFDGSNDYVAVAQDPNLETTRVSVAVWANIDRFTNWDGIVEYCQDNSSDESGWYFCTYNGHVEWNVSVNGSLCSLLCYPPTSTWTHLVGTYDGQHVRLYMNGAEVGSGVAAAGSIDWTFTPLELNIGRYYDDNEDVPFDGRIDDVRIYNYALSDQKVLDLFNLIPDN